MRTVKKPLCVSLSAAIALSLLLAGCGQGGEPPAAAPKQTKTDTAGTEPVTLKIFNHNAGINGQKDVDDIFIAAVQKKYPNISFELIPSGKTLNQLVAAGEIPDIIPTSNFYLNDLIDLGLVTDLNDLVKKDQIDLNRFEPEAVKAVKQFGKNGELYGMPYTMNYGVMVYNKNIFDKFGIAYPTDGMTWSQVIELGKKLTKLQDGIQYIGLDPGDANALTRAYSLPVADEKQEKSIVATEGYQKVFSLLKQIYDIPGMVKDKKFTYGINTFIKEQRVAMIPYWIAAYTSRIPQVGDAFQWDLVTYPMFDDRPGIGREIDFHMLVAPPAGKHKEAAQRVISALVSEEAQKSMNRGTRMTIFKDPNMRKEFAADSKLYDGKNLAGIFKVQPAPVAPSPKYELDIYAVLRDAMKNIAVNNMDINTALRTADEKANKIISDAKANSK